MKMRVIVAGSRDFVDYELMKVELDSILQHVLPNVIIVSGRAKGADQLGERYADERSIQKTFFPADWRNLDVPGAVIKQNAYGKYNAKAGTDRNEQMAVYTAAKGYGALVAFWAGDAGGTSNMIKTAERFQLQVRTVRWSRK